MFMTESEMILLVFFVCSAVWTRILASSLYQDESIQMATFMNELLDFNNTNTQLNKMGENSAQFWLYTRSNPDKYQVLKINDSASLLQSNFDFEREVKLIVHGWITNGTSFAPNIIKSAYLSVNDVNIIILDWSYAAMSKYIFASYCVNKIGSILTEFLEFLVDEGVTTENIHLIGHSLGAHVVGIAGNYYYLQRKPINAITGLDPAYPLYQYTSEEWRLDKSDAKHVEVIHTCGGYLGFPSPLGHIDFYPNGGKRQPGCGIDIIGHCAHDRSAAYFADSIKSKVPFTAVKCESYHEISKYGYCNNTKRHTLNMSGTKLHYGDQGIFYLKTKSELPYALGDPKNWIDS